MTVKSNYTIKEFGVFSIGIILYFKIEAENNKMHWLEQILVTILTDGQNGLY